MDLGLKGRTALVMGASQGLGQATAMQLAEEGAHVILVARREDVLTSVQQQIEDAGGSAEVACCDLFDRASRQALCQLIENLPRLDVLVANSGGPAPGMAPGIASEVWTQEFDAMVLGLIEIIDTAVIRMKDAKFGRIVVIGSSGIVTPIPKLAVSNTLRSALAGYIKTLSEQMAPFGVTCNVVLPGRIDTPRTKAIDAGGAKAESVEVEEIRARSWAGIPMGRYGTPVEFASMVVFLASVRASYITGIQARVDGGAMKSINV
ncbi:SDR family oxidoreductase [Litoricola sp.]|nr:SDR family oxidoreductase [Litorivicinus sp.]MDB2619980.1 SDR family oxidoreductase [Litorivicinaceae bacterium]